MNGKRIIRKIDELGRVIVPKEIRIAFRLNEGVSLKFSQIMTRSCLKSILLLKVWRQLPKIYLMLCISRIKRRSLYLSSFFVSFGDARATKMKNMRGAASNTVRED